MSLDVRVLRVRAQIPEFSQTWSVCCLRLGFHTCITCSCNARSKRLGRKLTAIHEIKLRYVYCYSCLLRVVRRPAITVAPARHQRHVVWLPLTSDISASTCLRHIAFVILMFDTNHRYFDFSSYSPASNPPDVCENPSQPNFMLPNCSVSYMNSDSTESSIKSASSLAQLVARSAVTRFRSISDTELHSIPEG